MKIAYFSRICHHTKSHDTALNGPDAAVILVVHTDAMFVLLISGHMKVLRWGGLQ